MANKLEGGVNILSLGEGWKGGRMEGWKDGRMEEPPKSPLSVGL